MARRILSPTPRSLEAKKKRRRQVTPAEAGRWRGRLLLQLESPDPRLLDKETAKIYQRIRQSGARVEGPIPLPVRTVSGTLGKGGRQCTHVRCFQIYCPRDETISVLDQLSLSQIVRSSILVEEVEEIEGTGGGRVRPAGSPS